MASFLWYKSIQQVLCQDHTINNSKSIYSTMRAKTRKLKPHTKILRCPYYWILHKIHERTNCWNLTVWKHFQNLRLWGKQTQKSTAMTPLILQFGKGQWRWHGSMVAGSWERSALRTSGVIMDTFFTIMIHCQNVQRSTCRMHPFY